MHGKWVCVCFHYPYKPTSILFIPLFNSLGPFCTTISMIPSGALKVSVGQKLSSVNLRPEIHANENLLLRIVLM